MKAYRILVLVVLLAAAVGFAAFAQETGAQPPIGQPGSLLEVYGLIDAAGRVSTNASSTGTTYVGFSQGLFNGSRFGIRGAEDLGIGVKAIYTLEGGVILPVGLSDQQAQIFGRQVWIGLASDYGTLTFGRQYGTFSDALGIGDVFGTGHGNVAYDNGTNFGSNDSVNAFFYQQMGFRWDNSAKYSGTFSGVTVGLMGAVPNVPDNAANTMYSASLGYNGKDLPVAFSVGVQGEEDASSNHHYNVGGGVKFPFDPTDAVYAFYFHSQFDAGFTRINANNSEMKTPGAFGRTDDIANVGVNYYVIPATLNAIVSYYFDYAQNVQASGDNGMRNSGLVALDYFFSKEFDAYVAGSYTRLSSALVNTANGGDAPGGTAVDYDNVFSFMLGARYRF